MTAARDVSAIAHHPGADWLVAYAAGSLGEAESLLVACHLTLCPACRAAAADAEAIGGPLLDGTAAEAYAHPLPATLPAVDAPPPAASHGPAAMGSAPLPAPLRAMLGGGLEAARWHPAARGLRRAAVRTAGPARALLLHASPGAAIPDHGHGGPELTLVLAGAYADAFGTFARGDVADHDEAAIHRPVAQPGAPCVCLVVQATPLRFRAPWLRLLRPLLGA